MKLLVAFFSLIRTLQLKAQIDQKNYKSTVPHLHLISICIMQYIISLFGFVSCGVFVFSKLKSSCQGL
jgi:hypothetical protein